MYYLPYKGYAPSYLLNESTCQLDGQDYLLEGSLDVWFQPNAFGGACAYLIFIGVPQEHRGVGIATITRQFEWDGASLMKVGIITFLTFISML